VFWENFLSCDLVLDLSGDSISDDYPPYSLATIAMPLIITRILKKPYMLCAQSIGPFGNSFIHRILITLIRDAAVITTRERITDEILSKLHIHGNVIPAQDLAFCLEPTSKERIDEICKQEGIKQHLSWTGISISDLISAYAFGELPPDQRRMAYVDAMAAFADWIIETYDMNILFVPHVVIPNVGNDLIITREIFNRMKSQDKAIVLNGLYNGDELKGIIGLSRLFVGSRMHATIGALSQGIPTMTYVYNHKTIGINGQILKQQEYLVDIREIRHTDLLDRSKEVFCQLEKNSTNISSLLNGILPEIIHGAKANAWIALNLLEIAGPLARMSNTKRCCGCGACAGACVDRVLEMQYTNEGTLRPRLVKKCNNCGRCIKACPVLGFDISLEENEIFGQKAVDPEIGVVRKAYKGYAMEPGLRLRSSSGGLVTGILAELLKTGEIEAVLSVVDNPEDPLRPKGAWITNTAELVKSSGSKYTPVALLESICDLLPDLKKIAVVGLPCHLWGLHLLEKNKFLKGKQVVLKLGLFCGRTPSGQSIEFIMNKNNIRPQDVKKISYRGNGWPGGLMIETQSDDVFYPLDEIWPFLAAPYFHSTHCFFCRDFFAHMSDLSFGDAWLPECENNNEGWSLCVVRSTVGEKVIAACNKHLHLEEIEMQRIKEAMIGNISAKCRQGALKESLFPESSSVTVASPADEDTPSQRKKMIIRLEHFWSKVGKSRAFQHGFLDYPFNRFMRINNRIISFIKSK
ncbi:MAG: Coenzyme F420 hydrogenase/dehydrogenase, beta subunit C-terminal domain, partial [Proteobacteria bacterium]|nr:Coenzyme F420 hydrogenase/dehydrogenase, beta subunit C-terminal domain [Pseudomonadota bacterium]